MTVSIYTSQGRRPAQRFEAVYRAGRQTLHRIVTASLEALTAKMTAYAAEQYARQASNISTVETYLL